MPPPMPLSGTGARNCGGSHASSARSRANAGRIASQAASGDGASPIAAATSATKPRTTGVSSTYSTSTGRSLRVRVWAQAQVLEAGVDGQRHDHRARAEALGEPPRHRDRLLVLDRLDGVD